MYAPVVDESRPMGGLVLGFQGSFPLGAVLMTDENRIQDLKRQLRVELEARHQRQQSALLHLAQLPANTEMSLLDMYRSVTRTAAHVLKCERASVWLFNAKRTELECLDHYVYSENNHHQDDNRVIER